MKEENKGKKNNKSTIIILVVIVLIIILLGVYASKHKNAKNVVNTNTNNGVTTSDDGTTDENSTEGDTDTKVEGTDDKFVETLDSGIKVNTSDKLKQSKNVNGLLFENIQLTEENGQTTLLADVTNNTGKDIDTTLVDVTFLDENGNAIATIGGIISPAKAGEKKQFNASATLSYVGVYDFNIVVK